MLSAYYARYYLGQRFWVMYWDGSEAYDVIQSVSENGNDVFGFDNDLYFWQEKQIKDFKLILKRPYDMSETDKRKYKKLCKRVIMNGRKNAYLVDTPESLVFLFEHGFDAFDLIRKKLALDEKVVKIDG